MFRFLCCCILFFVLFVDARLLRTIDSTTIIELLEFVQADFPLASQLATDENFCPRSLADPQTTDMACDGDGYITEASFVSTVSH